MTIATTQLIRGQANITSAFAALTGRRSQLLAETNLLLVSAIVHTHEHGDVTVLDAWASAFPAKSTANAQVMAFIKKFAPAKYVKDADKFKLDKGARIETKTVDVDGEMVTTGFVDSELGQLLLDSTYDTFQKEKGEAKPKTFDASFMAWNAVASLEKSFEKNGVTLEGDALAALNALKAAVKQQAVDFSLQSANAAAREKALKKFL